MLDVEKTGLSNQFYEKFGIRYNISQILKMLWNDYPSIYRDRIRHESVEHWDTFVKFVNLLMNDTTYLLDESLGSLTEIHALQIEMDHPDFASKSEVCAHMDRRYVEVDGS
jgi:ubiquitin conjugation factor E4 B